MSAFKNHRRPKYIKFPKSGNSGNKSQRKIMTLSIRIGEILVVLYRQYSIKSTNGASDTTNGAWTPRISFISYIKYYP